MKRLFAIGLSLLMFAPQVQGESALTPEDKNNLRGIYVPESHASKNRQDIYSQGYLSGSSKELHFTDTNDLGLLHVELKPLTQSKSNCEKKDWSKTPRYSCFGGFCPEGKDASCAYGGSGFKIVRLSSNDWAEWRVRSLNGNLCDTERHCFLFKMERLTAPLGCCAHTIYANHGGILIQTSLDYKTIWRYLVNTKKQAGRSLPVLVKVSNRSTLPMIYYRGGLLKVAMESGVRPKPEAKPEPKQEAQAALQLKLVGTGKHIIEFGGGTYIGEVSNGVPHGQGVWTESDGRIYVGDWKDGKTHGKGTFTFFLPHYDTGHGFRYAGEFKNSEMHGQGTLTYIDGQFEGDKLIGNFTPNKIDGGGAYISNDGGKFVGEIKDTTFWNGIDYDANGTINGTYSAGKACYNCSPNNGQRALVAEVTKAFKELISGSRDVWCATQIYAFETTELFCRENNGKKYSTRELADAEHKRLNATSSTSSSSNSDAALELEYWNVVKKSNDVDLLQAYLDEYPNGKFAPLAKLKIKKLNSSSGDN